MADKYEDFDTRKMQKLRREVARILDQGDRVVNYDLAENHIDWSKIGWSKATGEKALLFLRRKLEEQGVIDVETDDDGPTTSHEWIVKSEISYGSDLINDEGGREGS